MKNKLFQELILIVGENNILRDPRDLEKYNKDWRGFYKNKCLCVVFPKNTDVLQDIVKYCYKRNIKIVPQGGNTSLTGASVPSYNMKEIMEKLDQQNLTVADYNTMIKVIAASLQRGTIRPEECTTVGRLYEKLQYMIEKTQKENTNARLSETDN